tara:strand:- start:850 stop:1734 length:885 start_codon:yes stop_codon:yes gene_type:complete
MKKFISFIIIFLLTNTANANELESTINKIYNKGSEAAEGYITNLFSGPGETEVSISGKNENKPTGNIMIIRPFSIHEDSLTFYQAQLNSYHVLGESRQSINYGVGTRFLSDSKSSFWGLNTFLDRDTKDNTRLSFGSEYSTSNFDITANYYLGVGSASKVGANTERVLDGYDFNISGQAPYAPWANISYNNYTWKADKAATGSNGDIYSLSLNLSNSLTLEGGYDDNNLQDSMDFIRLTYSTSGKNRPTIMDGFSSGAFTDSDVSEDMLTKVKRKNTIVLEIESSGVVIANGNT